MNVLILVFSPAGSTLKVSRLLEDRLTEAGHAVKLLNLTRNRTVFKEGDIAGFLRENVAPHDLLCIGSPVYEKHVEAYVQSVYRNLPAPDEIWGKHAVSFFTYGGISTGAALKESDELLRKGGREPIAHMKVESSHIKTKYVKTRVNENMPGEEALPHIDELVRRIDSLDVRKTYGKIAGLNFQSHREKILCSLLKEPLLHKYLYGRLTVLNDVCSGCGACLKACPVQRIEMAGGKAFMTDTDPSCIHCFSCVNVCPRDGITYENGEEGWRKIERIYGKVAREGSPIRSGETPRSGVYPVETRS